MVRDKFSAIWVSHSSISDYMKCARAYYLNNVYRDPKTNHRISLMQPSLALGQAVHSTLDTLSKKSVDDRSMENLHSVYGLMWEKVSGKKGGFTDSSQEEKYRNRGQDMIDRIIRHPGPLKKQAIKIRQDLPYFWLSEEEGIILCGKIDWLEYLPDTDSVKIIDFKTGKFDEDAESLQLPIYYLLAQSTQSKSVSGVSYWYLDRDDEPVDLPLPDPVASRKNVLEIAKKIALARKLDHFVCRSKDGCRACRQLEAIVTGKAEFIGLNDFGQDLYIL